MDSVGRTILTSPIWSCVQLGVIFFKEITWLEVILMPKYLKPSGVQWKEQDESSSSIGVMCYLISWISSKFLNFVL